MSYPFLSFLFFCVFFLRMYGTVSSSLSLSLSPPTPFSLSLSLSPPTPFSLSLSPSLIQLSAMVNTYRIKKEESAIGKWQQRL